MDFRADLVVAIGAGRLYVTESVTGTVLVADLGSLATSLRGAQATKQSISPLCGLYGLLRLRSQ